MRTRVAKKRILSIEFNFIYTCVETDGLRVKWLPQDAN
jgi:hypothetical protein